MSASVLFVCKKNGGKSQMAAALMRQHAGDAITVYSAGTAPGDTLSALAEEAIVEVGASMEGEYPKPIDPEILRSVDRVIVLGDEAKVPRSTAWPERSRPGPSKTRLHPTSAAATARGRSGIRSPNASCASPASSAPRCRNSEREGRSSRWPSRPARRTADEPCMSRARSRVSVRAGSRSIVRGRFRSPRSSR